MYITFLSSEPPEIAEKVVINKFSSSVVVSACDGDGSVPRAIQALVRHLVDRRIKINPIRQSMKAERKSIKKRKKGDYVPLTATKVNEVNTIFIYICNILSSFHGIF